MFLHSTISMTSSRRSPGVEVEVEVGARLGLESNYRSGYVSKYSVASNGLTSQWLFGGIIGHPTTKATKNVGGFCCFALVRLELGL